MVMFVHWKNHLRASTDVEARNSRLEETIAIRTLQDCPRLEQLPGTAPGNQIFNSRSSQLYRKEQRIASATPSSSVSIDGSPALGACSKVISPTAVGIDAPIMSACQESQQWPRQYTVSWYPLCVSHAQRHIHGESRETTNLVAVHSVSSVGIFGTKPCCFSGVNGDRRHLRPPTPSKF